MNTQQNRWMPLVAGIGIGAAAASMMRGNAGQLKKFIPMVTQMTTGTLSGIGGASALNNVTTGQQQDSQDQIQ
jgi:TRAP-type uncharacterized transport system fused permease subunit